MSSTVYMQSQGLGAEPETDLSIRDRVWSLFSRLNPFSSETSPESSCVLPSDSIVSSTKNSRVEQTLQKNTACSTRDNSAEQYGFRAYLATGFQQDLDSVGQSELADFHRALQKHGISTSLELCMAVCLAKRYRAALYENKVGESDLNTDNEENLEGGSFMVLQAGCWDLSCTETPMMSKNLQGSVDGKMCWVACVMLACKLAQDEPYDNAAFARVSNIPLRILNRAEKSILQTLKYTINVQREEFEYMRSAIPDSNTTE